ncbi:MAG: FdtA/QdtA family cupin domain-containing protein [Gemmatimonadaceae bacterium]
MTVHDCRIIGFPRISDPRGSLSVIENRDLVPFDIERVFYIYDLPERTNRGGHAHRTCEEVIIPVAGEFKVEVDDGRERRTHTLSNPSEGLYIPARTWLELQDLSPGCVCLVLASIPHDPADYYRDYAEYVADMRQAGG